MINKLIAKIQKTKAPIVVGLDPMLSYIPEHIQKVPPVHIPHLPVKGQGQHRVHVKPFPEQPLPVLGRVDQPGRLPQHQGVGMGAKGHHTRPAAPRRRHPPAGGQQGGVADVYPIKKAQGIDRLVHGFPISPLRRNQS